MMLQKSLQNSNPWEKNNLTIPLKPSKLIVVETMLLLSHFLMLMESNIKFHAHTYLNKMVGPKGRIDTLLKWDEAFSTVVHLINGLPTPVLSNKSSYEMIFYQVPNYSSLLIFCCS